MTLREEPNWVRLIQELRSKHKLTTIEAKSGIITYRLYRLLDGHKPYWEEGNILLHLWEKEFKK